MICLLQRVSEASVSVDGHILGEIGTGLMVLCGFEPEDDAQVLDKMAHRLLHYRVFADENGKMNRNVMDANGELLMVPQFTLAADTSKGLRPSFHTSASPDTARELFHQWNAVVSNKYMPPASGQFGADMKVGLVNDGPVTFWLQVTSTKQSKNK